MALLEGCNWRNKEQAGAARLCDMPPSDRAPNMNEHTKTERKNNQPGKYRELSPSHDNLCGLVLSHLTSAALPASVSVLAFAAAHRSWERFG